MFIYLFIFSILFIFLFLSIFWLFWFYWFFLLLSKYYIGSLVGVGLTKLVSDVIIEHSLRGWTITPQISWLTEIMRSPDAIGLKTKFWEGLVRFNSRAIRNPWIMFHYMEDDIYEYSFILSLEVLEACFFTF